MLHVLIVASESASKASKGPEMGSRGGPFEGRKYAGKVAKLRLRSWRWVMRVETRKKVAPAKKRPTCRNERSLKNHEYAVG